LPEAKRPQFIAPDRMRRRLANENRKVTPTRVPNAELRTREYLTRLSVP
jgi:hypothetical protein